MMRILVTGGCGYVGSRLTPVLLAEGHAVTVYDALIFGPNMLPDHRRLRVIEGDIRDSRHVEMAMREQQSVIHLAFLSNDPQFRLDPAVATAVNLRGFETVLEAALANGVDRLILASSCSVYGTAAGYGEMADEGHPLTPLTAYAMHKAECEKRLFAAAQPGFCSVSLRATTVCGYAPRQRLDLTFNRFAVDGYLKRRIVVRRGASYRPFVALSDLVAVYALLLRAPREAVSGRAFNAAYGNLTLADSALALAAHIGADVALEADDNNADDARSYRISSRRLEQALGFRPHSHFVDAASEVIAGIRSGQLVDPETNPAYDNLTLQQRYDWSRFALASG
ncbi:nucleoside-diphosphate-sugar epimerase [Paraburkholderia sp. Clong3]|uniref:NAD-dependent epimerase/dehydratase family protein n=1 Tax=Paraburkholderia sp. Clong3 TaxID=2991061 RepID=UPI003D21FD9C